MRAKLFLRKVEDQRIVDAIREAGGKTSAEIRVFVCHHRTTDAVAAAHREFGRLGLHESEERNAVLIYVSPKSKKFAVIGDRGIHEHCGDEFWGTVAREMEGYFRKEEWTEGLLHGISKAGELLAEKFPKRG